MEANKQIDNLLKVGEVAPVTILRRELSGWYYLQFWDPRRKRTLRETANTKNLEKAKSAARRKKLELQQDQEKALQTKSERLTVDKALDTGIRLGGRRNRGKGEGQLEDLLQSKRYFSDWLQGRVRYWEDVDSQLVNEYIESLVTQSPKTRRAYIAPVAMAAKYWASVDSRKYRPLYIAHPLLELHKRETIPHLALADLYKCIDRAGERNFRYAAIAFTLGGFAGLRLEEIAFIERRDWDSEKQVLDIRREKTKYSKRKIPVLPEVAAFLDSCFATSPSPYLVQKRNGTIGTHKTLSDQVREILIECGLKMAPHEAARTTFENLTLFPGVHEGASRRYTGRAPIGSDNQFYKDWNPAKLKEMFLDSFAAHLTKQVRQLKKAGKPTAATVQNPMQSATVQA